MTPKIYSEQELIEKPTLELLGHLGYEVIDAYTEQFGPEHIANGAPGRDDRSEVFLRHRLRPKLAELNPELPPQALDLAVEQLVRDRSAMDPVRANHAVWRLLRDGATVTFTADDGGRETETVRFLDWSDSQGNDFLAVSQLWIVGPLHTRRTDIVCFVNGIPLVLLELKASHRSVEHAYKNNLRDYRDTIPQLFTPNGLVILSNGSETKVGATFAPSRLKPRSTIPSTSTKCSPTVRPAAFQFCICPRVPASYLVLPQSPKPREIRLTPDTLLAAVDSTRLSFAPLLDGYLADVRTETARAARALAIARGERAEPIGVGRTPNRTLVS